MIRPGQFGPISLVFELRTTVSARIMSSVGMPSVMQTASGNAGVGRFHDRVGRARRRHENHGRIGAGCLHGVGDGIEHRPAFMRRPALAGRDAADDLRAVRRRLLGVEGPLAAGDALNDEARAAIDQYGH